MKTIFYILALAMLVGISSAYAEVPPSYIMQWNTAANGTGLHQPKNVAVLNSNSVVVLESGGRLMRYSSSGVFEAVSQGSYKNVATSMDYVYSMYSKWLAQMASNLTTNVRFIDVGAVSPLTSNFGGISVNSLGDMYYVDITHRLIVRYLANGSLWGTWPIPGSAYNLAISPNGDVYIIDIGNHRIMKYSATGVFQLTWGSFGTDPGQFDSPKGIAVDSKGDVYVADTNNNRIQKFTGSGSFLCEWGVQGFGNGEFQQPQGVAVDEQGYVYVADTNAERIQKFGGLTTPATKTSWGRLKSLYR